MLFGQMFFENSFHISSLTLKDCFQIPVWKVVERSSYGTKWVAGVTTKWRRNRTKWRLFLKEMGWVVGDVYLLPRNVERSDVDIFSLRLVKLQDLSKFFWLILSKFNLN